MQQKPLKPSDLKVVLEPSTHNPESIWKVGFPKIEEGKEPWWHYDDNYISLTSLNEENWYIDGTEKKKVITLEELIFYVWKKADVIFPSTIDEKYNDKLLEIAENSELVLQMVEEYRKAQIPNEVREQTNLSKPSNITISQEKEGIICNSLDEVIEVNKSYFQNFYQKNLFPTYLSESDKEIRNHNFNSNIPCSLLFWKIYKKGDVFIFIPESSNKEESNSAFAKRVNKKQALAKGNIICELLKISNSDWIWVDLAKIFNNILTEEEIGKLIHGTIWMSWTHNNFIIKINGVPTKISLSLWQENNYSLVNNSYQKPIKDWNKLFFKIEKEGNNECDEKYGKPYLSISLNIFELRRSEVGIYRYPLDLKNVDNEVGELPENIFEKLKANIEALQN